MPLEPKKPLAYGDAVRMMPGAEAGRADTESKEEVMIGWGLK